MQDIINSFKAHLYDRTSSPLVGSFIFYWLVCNYKFVMVIFDGDLKVIEKFEVIKTLYPQDVFTLWTGFKINYYTLLGNGLLIPLIISLIYIFLVPYPSKYIYEFWKNKQKEIHDIKQKIDDETPLTKEQSKKIRQDIINLEIEYENSFRRKDEEIYQLKEMLKVQEDEGKVISQKKFIDLATNSNEEKVDTNSVLESIEEKILLYLAKFPKDYILTSDVCKYIKESQTKIDYYLEKLKIKNYIVSQYNNNVRESEYKIYQNGREYLVKNNLI